MELKATSPAAYSRSPWARSFQTMTMAMQRARPIMIRPNMYSGLSRRKMTARANIRSGPMIQFWTRESDEDLDVPEDVAELLVLHLGQGRVHHQDEADGDGDVGRPGLEPVDEADDGRDEIAQPDADGHGQEDPEGQVSVEELESAGFRVSWAAPFTSVHQR